MADTLDERVVELEEILKTLVGLYIANRGGKNEFVSCITPKSSSQMTPRERITNKVWAAWDSAMIALEEKEWQR